MHQYFEVMTLSLRTLNSDHFAFEECSPKHNVISCSVIFSQAYDKQYSKYTMEYV